MNIKVKLTRETNAGYYHAAKGDIISIPFEQYLLGVVASEMGDAPLEACKAQAVAARTYALPYLMKGAPISDASSTAQAYRAERAADPVYENAHRGVKATAGLVLYYGGKPLTSCPFSKSNGGREISNAERWNSTALPYLPSQDDPWDLAATNGKKLGHGVGMSQEGAKYAAGTLGKTCEEILLFYYSGCEIHPVEEKEVPTAMIGTVTTANGGALNMRKYPGASADRILKIPNGAEISILSTETITDGWYEVEYNGQTGYVMAAYVSVRSESEPSVCTVGVRFDTRAEAEAFRVLLQRAKIY